MVAHDDPTKATAGSIDVDILKMLSPKQSLSDAVDQCLSHGDPSASQHHLNGVLLNQMNIKTYVKKHRDKAREGLFAEFLKLHYINAFMPINKQDLTREQIKGFVRAMSVIKDKRDVTLK